MSSVQTITKKMVLMPHKMEEKRLVRTSSLEKIRRFNSFICSQQYYVLPALIAWLRSSQSVLQVATEKTIFFFRYLIFTHFLFKLYQVDFKSLLANVRVLFNRTIESQNLLKFSVFLIAPALGIKLGLCFYLLSQTCVPSGLVFLTVCWFYIIYLNYKSVYFEGFEKKNVIKKKN